MSAFPQRGYTRYTADKTDSQSYLLHSDPARSNGGGDPHLHQQQQQLHQQSHLHGHAHAPHGHSRGHSHHHQPGGGTTTSTLLPSHSPNWRTALPPPPPSDAHGMNFSHLPGFDTLHMLPPVGIAPIMSPRSFATTLPPMWQPQFDPMAGMPMWCSSLPGPTLQQQQPQHQQLQHMSPSHPAMHHFGGKHGSHSFGLDPTSIEGSGQSGAAAAADQGLWMAPSHMWPPPPVAYSHLPPPPPPPHAFYGHPSPYPPNPMDMHYHDAMMGTEAAQYMSGGSMLQAESELASSLPPDCSSHFESVLPQHPLESPAADKAPPPPTTSSYDDDDATSMVPSTMMDYAEPELNIRAVSVPPPLVPAFHMTPTSQHSNEQQAPKSRAKPGRPPTKRARAVAASDTASSSSSPASTARASVAALRGALRAAARGDAIRGSATLSALATGAPLPVDPDVDRAATSASAASEGSPTPSLTASAIAAALVAQYNSLPIPDRRKYFCPHEGCGKQFTSSGHRNRHEKSVHSGKKPFECPFPTCKASFARNDNLQQHYTRHFTELRQDKAATTDILDPLKRGRRPRVQKAYELSHRQLQQPLEQQQQQQAQVEQPPVPPPPPTLQRTQSQDSTMTISASQRAILQDDMFGDTDSFTLPPVRGYQQPAASDTAATAAVTSTSSEMEADFMDSLSVSS